MRRHLLLSSALFTATAIASIACGSGSDSISLEARITAASGGELRSANGSFVLTVPPGAVAEDVTVSVEEVNPGESTSDIPDIEGPGFELKPDGLQFLKPATVSLKLPFDELDIDAESGAAPVFDLFTVSGDGAVSGLGNVTNEFDASTGELTLSGEIAHFSSLVRTKQKLNVYLEQVEPALKLVGDEFYARGQIDEFDSPLGYDVSWTARGLRQLRLDEATAWFDPRSQAGRYTNEKVVLGADGAVRPVGIRAIDESQIGVSLKLTCIAQGTGIYSLDVDAAPKGSIERGIAPRRVRIALQATVQCADTAEARATVTAIALETALSAAVNPIYTPTPPGYRPCGDGAVTSTGDCVEATSAAPTPTAIPATSTPTSVTPTATPRSVISRADEKLRLVVIASTGEAAPGTDGSTFTDFDISSTGGDKAYFYGFTESGRSGVWWFEEDELVGATLENLIVSKAPSAPGGVVHISGGPLSVSQSGLIAVVARFKQEYDPLTNLEFVEFVSVYSGKQGSSIELVRQGDPAPGRSAQSRFTQFYSAQVAESSLVVYQAFADRRGFWLADGLGSSFLAADGEALTALGDGWKDSGSNRMASAGVTRDGKTLFHLADAFIPVPGENDLKVNGLWLISPEDGSQVIATSTTRLPDGSYVEQVAQPSMNASGIVAFKALTSFSDGGPSVTSTAIWKTNGNGALKKVAEPGFTVDGLEITEISSPLVLPDGRVAFTGTAFDSTNSLIHAILAESGNGFDVLARTDALPGPVGNTVSAVPFAIRQFSTNSSGHIAFEIGLGDSIWMQSPGGHLHRVIGIGDTLQVPGASGPASKTVSFVQYAGGASTGNGLPTGFSDTGKLSIKVTFSDGTRSLVMATFDEAPVVR